MRFLAIDAGDKRTGFALGDDITRIVTPLVVAETPSQPALITACARLIDEHGPDALVLGLPLHPDGSETPRSAAARELAGVLSTATGLRVHLQDERLTSFDAEDKLNMSGRTRGGKRAVRDALAACAILEEHLRASQ